MNDDALVVAEDGGREQRRPRGREREADAGSSDEVERLRNAMQLARRHAGVLGVSAIALAAERLECRDNLVADPPAVDLRAELGDLAGHVHAEDVRQRLADEELAAAMKEVGVVDRRGVHPQQHFTGARHGHRHILVAQRCLDTDLRQLLLHNLAEALPLGPVWRHVVHDLEAHAAFLPREPSFIE